MEGGGHMEYRIKKVGSRKYELTVRTEGFERCMHLATDVDRRITAFFIYLALTGQLTLNDNIVGKPFPVDEEIQNALGVLARNF